ncbi:STM4504/CBY_0614 family protein [Clostridium butyricum]|uniref:STM4504/CBY_0614 family protein n=1 Tax=Clostridium butyricum TaxID=1492 RepID=UPI0013D062ED|nr:hypothetical protein [Clostridium butyricum]MCQ2017851.1 hypothetical protein [Clostridium butyricum]MCQ2021677.1 hypothetical protein [Clostridium butyricum]NFB72169.1 hypothetical protein [Clostridium butyricum]NFB92003.1 hypothetical protein [Clostridium butyricum]UTY52886.1 hypothetical protein HNS01_07185 [Clostridium butyricum]
MIYEPYSRRLKKSNERKSDVYTYDEISDRFRQQVIYIARNMFNNQHWLRIRDTMATELGTEYLAVSKRSYHPYTTQEECENFIRETDYENVLDITELIARIICDEYQDDEYTVKKAIDELNYRFKDNNLGYEFINNELIRIDTELIHKEIIKPAIKLLYDEDFEGACDEFFKAHECYRNGRYEDAITNAGKAFESTMKNICKNLEYEYNEERDNASTLIGRLESNGFIPKYEKAGFNDLNNLMKSLKNSLVNNLPVVRNKRSAHGTGSMVREISESVVEYAINMCATNIVYLVKTYRQEKE